jgi:hypothetical protein
MAPTSFKGGEMDDIKEMNRVLKLLSRAERLLKSGETMDDVLIQLQITRHEFESYFDEYGLPPNCGESLTKSTVGQAVFPIFHEAASGELEHVGSGVLLEIGQDTFALSAAHVTDFAKGGSLFMPAADEIAPMNGSISYGKLPESGDRRDDRVDLAYFHLDENWRSEIHPDFTPASVNDLLLTNTAKTGNIHTFSGYPWRKTKHRGNTFAGDQTTYTGHLLPPDIYQQLGYRREGHVLIRMRRNKTHSTRYGPNSPAARPEGVSGGAVCSWPAAFKDRVFAPRLKIAAIAHSYHEYYHCMAATRVIPLVMAIISNNPHLAECFEHIECMNDELRLFINDTLNWLRQNMHADAVGIAWYTADTYDRCRRSFADASDFSESFSEWKVMAESLETALKAQGTRPVRAMIDPNSFPSWCAEHGFQRIDQNARMAFANLKAFESLQTMK